MIPGPTQDYPEVQALKDAVERHRLSFSLPETPAAVKEIGYRLIKMHWPGDSLLIPVEDEYEDADREIPALMLHLVLAECEMYEEAEDFLVWARELGLDAADPAVRRIHMNMRTLLPRIRGLLGPELHALSSLEIQLNSGAAQALRAKK